MTTENETTPADLLTVEPIALGSSMNQPRARAVVIDGLADYWRLRLTTHSGTELTLATYSSPEAAATARDVIRDHFSPKIMPGRLPTVHYEELPASATATEETSS